MTLNEIYEIIRQKARMKNNRTLGVDEYNAILRGVNIRKLENEAKLVELDQRSMDVMSVLKKAGPLTIDANGLASKPADYFRKVSITKDDVDIEVIPEDALQEIINSPVYPPSATDAVCAIRATQIQFYPITLASANLLYYKYPLVPNYVEKVDPASGLPIQDASTSIEFEWPQSEHMNLLDMILAEVDVYYESQVEQINK